MTGEIESAIEQAYEMALKKVKEGRLYGEQIDLDNPKHVGLSLYLIGFQEGKQEAVEYLEFLGK